jgi:hypothetical protein
MISLSSQSRNFDSAPSYPESFILAMVSLSIESEVCFLECRSVSKTCRRFLCGEGVVIEAVFRPGGLDGGTMGVAESSEEGVVGLVARGVF